MQDVDMQVEVPPVEFCFSRSSLDAVVKIVFIEDSGYGGGGGDLPNFISAECKIR